jgi:hypothetical protein
MSNLTRNYSDYGSVFIEKCATLAHVHHFGALIWGLSLNRLMTFPSLGDSMRMEEINAKIPIESRLAIEKFAIQREISLGAATRHFLKVGIQAAGVVA